MSIPLSKYIPISSSVGGTTLVQNRQLIGRLTTVNPLQPTGSILEFTSAPDVGAYYGTTSDEYLRASSSTYFNYLTKNNRRPQKISFARWADEDTAPLIFGARFTTTLAAFQLIDDGTFTLIIGGVSHNIDALDFTAAANLAAVATIIQTEIRTNTGTQWTAATVVYDATRGAFNFTGGDVGAATISATVGGVGTDILNLIGWGAGAIFSDGADEQTITEFLDASTNLSNNFGSFAFIPTLTLDQVTEASVWNMQFPDQNVFYSYHVPVTQANAAVWSAALEDNTGTELTKSEISTEYPEQLAMANLAATDYNSANANTNYMYLQADLTPSVTDKTTSDLLDSLRINYYGQTQTAGQPISFYQRGVMMGPSNAPVDMNIYANEQWFKDAAGVALLSLLLGSNSLPANTQGVATVLGTLQAVIDQALINGTILVEKQLTSAQKAFVTQVTGDSNSWMQVQAIGYWINAGVQSYPTVDNRIEFKIVYTLVYSKGDLVRKIEGSHILI